MTFLYAHITRETYKDIYERNIVNSSLDIFERGIEYDDYGMGEKCMLTCWSFIIYPLESIGLYRKAGQGGSGSVMSLFSFLYELRNEANIGEGTEPCHALYSTPIVERRNEYAIVL